MPHQWPALGGLDRHQPRQALGELQYLQGPRILDQPGDVLGDQVLGADQDVDGKAAQAVQVLGLVPLVEQLGLGQVGVGPDPADGGRGLVQQLGDLAGDHVGLIAVGDGNYHVAVFGTGLAEYGRV